MKKMMSIVLAFLGIQSFEKKDGKSLLTEDHRKQMVDAFGEPFTAKFEKYLAEGEAETPPANQSEDTNLGAELVLGMNAQHNAALTALQAQLEKERKDKLALQQSIAALSDKAEQDPPAIQATDLPRKEGVATVMKVDANKPHYQVANHFFRTGSMIGAESATIDVADLYQEFGTYLSQSGNNIEQINALFNGFTSAPYFTNTMAVTEWRAMQALITSVSQQFTNKWTPSGKSQFRPLSIRNRRHKINFPIIPSEVLESYLLHMYDEGLAVDQMPITKFIWQQLIFPQLMQDIELRMLFKGKYVEVTNSDVSEGDAGKPPEDSMDGVETILVDNLAGGNSKNIKYFDGEGFDYTDCTDQEILDFVSNFVSWLAPIYRTMAMPIACSYEFWKRYKVAYKNKWGAGSGTEKGNFGSDRVDYSNNVLTPMDGMYGSPILFATPKMNLRKLRHKNEVPRVINDVQKHGYEVRLFGEYWLGAGFAFGEAVFAYVPSGYNPKALITSVYGAHTSYQQNKGEDTSKSLVIGSGSGSGSAGGGI